MKIYRPGVWTDDEGTMHLDPGEFLKGVGVKDTVEEREKVIRMFKDLVREKAPEVTIIDEFDAEPPTP